MSEDKLVALVASTVKAALAAEKAEANASSKSNTVMAVKCVSKGYKGKDTLAILNALPRTSKVYKGKTYQTVKFDGHTFSLVFGDTAWMRIDY